jgi:long-chain acyl-CoA synthetase
MIETVDGLFREALWHYPHRPCVHRLASKGALRRTYAEQAARVIEVVRELERAGLRPGDRVLAYLDDPLASFSLTLACAHAGLVLLPLAPLFSISAARRLVERTGARGTVTTREHEQVLRMARLKPLTLSEARRPGPATPGAEECLRILEDMSKSHGPEDLYVLLPTSGTTGEPKLPLRTHRAATRRARQVALHLGIWPHEQARILLVAALTHSFAHTVLTVGLCTAAGFDIPSAVDTAAPLNEVRQLDSTHIFATPRVLRSLFAQRAALPPEQRGARLFGPAMRQLRLTGAASDEHVMRALQAEGVDVGESYGASECGAVALTAPGRWEPGCAGQVLRGIETRQAEDGELLVRVPDERAVYYGDLEATRAANDDEGYYPTGDTGSVASDGTLRLLGRKKDVFNTSEGSNVYPQRIEGLLEALPWVHQAVLIGDQRPFFAALLVPYAAEAGAQPENGHGSLDPTRAAELFERARADLGRVNAGLEAIERVRRFALLAHPFDATLYTPAQAGKARRARREIGQAFEPLIAALYAPDAPADWRVPE